MRLPPRPPLTLRTLVTGATLGTLGALLLVQLGAIEILGLHSYGWLITLSMVIGTILTIAGLGVVLLGGVGLLLAAYLLIAFTPIVDGAAERWVRDDGPITTPVDAIVVLSGWVKPDSMLEAVAVERLVTGLELVQAGAAPRLITTRVVANDGDVHRVSDQDQRRYVHLAGLESKWTELDSVATTRHEALRTADLVGAHGTVAVVTSPLHTKRACAVFEGAGLKVHCVPAKESVGVTRHPVHPGDRIQAFSEYLYERLGMVKYRWNGWIK